MNKSLLFCCAALAGLTACDGGTDQSAGYVQEAVETSQKFLNQTEQLANAANQQIDQAWDGISQAWLTTHRVLQDAGINLVPAPWYPDIELSRNSLMLNDAYVNGPGGMSGSLDGLTLNRLPGAEPAYALSGGFTVTLGGFTFEVDPDAWFSPESPTGPTGTQPNDGQTTGQ